MRMVPRGKVVLLTIGTAMECPQWVPGESIAVNGACLTVVRGADGEFDAEISPETIQRTTLGTLSPAEAVNLERALRLDERLGGHFVTGHVDAVGTITLHRDIGGVVAMEISVPESLMPLLVEKGSIAVDGVSLTINTVRETGFTVMVIPHTLARTTLGHARPGRKVNIETDMLGKYVYRYLAYQHGVRPGITEEFLARHGFM